MKLYKGDRIMQMVDKDQLDDCLAAGWSRTVSVKEVKSEPVKEPEPVKKETLSPITKKIKPLKRKY